jgi:acetate kinase
MNILVLNCGSSSLKYEIFLLPSEISLGKGIIERIGEKKGKITQQSKSGTLEKEVFIENHQTAMTLLATALTDKELGLVKSLSEVNGIGHRVVHGGEKYASSVLIDENVIAAIEENIELAPLHNPPNLTGIQAASNLFPTLPQVAVFDTAFHQTLEPYAYLYGLPREFHTKHRIRRYGFHGTSHRFVANRAYEMMKRSVENTNVISCHLGNGASVTAIENGISVDTSMGFTPLEGLMMGTRCGDIDPAIVLHLIKIGYTAKELDVIFNKKSGLLGLSCISNDLRDLEEAADNRDSNAIEALETYAHRIRKYIGAYAANLVKVDAVIFTGGIGQYGVKMRERICHRLENIGIVMDYELNKSNGSAEGIVSKNYSRTSILIIPTNEELQIAIDSYRLISSNQNT